jgi:hypothetical protein
MIKQLALLLALVGAPAVSAIELTPDNWDQQTDGKTVFLKFYAPWVSYTFHIIFNTFFLIIKTNNHCIESALGKRRGAVDYRLLCISILNLTKLQSLS